MPYRLAWEQQSEFVVRILFAHVGKRLSDSEKSYELAETPRQSQCNCEFVWVKESNNERAYFTGVPACVYDNVTSALFYLYEWATDQRLYNEW